MPVVLQIEGENGSETPSQRVQTENGAAADIISVTEAWPLEGSCLLSPACTWHRSCGCQLFERAVGPLVVVLQSLVRKIRRAECHTPRAPPLAPRAGNHSGAKTAAPGDSAPPVGGRQPDRCVSVGQHQGAHFLYLCISRVGVKDIREELARTGHPGNYQAMDIVTIDHEKL